MKVPLEEQENYLHQNKRVNETLIFNEHTEACSIMQATLITNMLKAIMYLKYLFAIENQKLILFTWSLNVNFSSNVKHAPVGSRVWLWS